MKTASVSVFTLAALASLSIFSASNAATATSSFQVNLTIQGECKVQSASNVDFGLHGVIDSNIDTTNAIGVQCTNSTPYTVALSAGAGSGATVGSRKMTSAANDTVTYTLYRDAGRSQIWGVTQNVDTQAATGNGAVQTYTAYGRVAAQSTPAMGAYSDLVSVTITY
ncbi:putative secreted protein [Caulobacter sp. AP07]|uniref:Csu type fimbrial protein n=1 Tax=Caulobacter sp. AP07 TaxID=1144304 RepID=UPI000271F7D5|nr:spore coat U domain-containing protein [Caulobacter sp. AP07]EJL27757.1 putative secreted protein [Caulobacter sp. AP07]